MRRALVLALLAACSTAMPAAAARPLLFSNPSAHARFAPGEVLVALGPGDALRLGPNARVESANPRLAAALARHGLDRFVEIPGRAGGRGATGTRFVRLVSARADFDPVRAAGELRATGGVRAAVPDYHVEMAATLPNDPYVNLQWAVSDSADGDIQLPEAWDLEKGSPSTVIAIVDLGVDTGHPDLVSKIWANPGEVLNGLDDDGNGLVDDVQGWDFGDGDNDPNPHAVLDAIGLDEGFHGTFVAGIAAAATNNAKGIAGSGWNCKIMPLKMVSTAGETRMDAVTGAFQYAAGKRADVLSMSFVARADSGVGEYFQALVDEAVSAGVVCVAAAGNDSSDSLVYPAACQNVIAVAATDQSNTRAWFSNWGPWVDVAAPGAMIWSTICRNYPFDFGTQLIYMFYFGWDGLNPYMYGDGTSMSCPLVAGVCGLLRSHAPGITPQQVEQRLVATGDLIAADHAVGVKVNAFRALDGLVTAAEGRAPPALGFGAAAPNPCRSASTLHFALPEAGEASLALYDLSGRLVRKLVSGALPAGAHSVVWDARDADGRRLPSGFYFARLASAGRVATQRVLLLK